MLSLALVLLPLVLAQSKYGPELTVASLPPLVLTRASIEREQNANFLTLHTDTPHAAPTAAQLRLLYGADEKSLRVCEDVVVLNANAVRCASVVPGAGVVLVVLERLDANGQVEARHRIDTHYPAPVVTALSGGDDDSVPLIVTGANFGPRDAALAAGVASHRVEVFVGPFPAHSAERPCAVIDDAGTQIRCGSLPIGFGTGLHVTVCVGGVCGASESPLHSFAEPVVLKTFRVGQRLHLVGHGFGPAIDAEAAHLVRDSSAPALTLELGGRPCANPEMIVADREIACDADDHVVTTSTVAVLARRDLRAAVHVKRSTAADISLDSVSPKTGATNGDFPLTVYGTNFGVVGQTVLVLVGGRPAVGCKVTESAADGSRDVAVCAKAPVGAGAELEVKVGVMDPAEAVGCSPNACVFSYDVPSVSSVSRPSTRGGSINVRGRNFGPSFIEKKVFVRVGGQEHECVVTRGSHERIQCDAPAGTGENLVIVVEVAHQRSRPARELSYRRPDIVSATRPHWRGGHIYIRGYNFGTEDKLVSVYIGDQECRKPKITQSHRVLRCYAPAGSADGKFHDLKVRVNGQSSAVRDGHASDRIQYTNTAPEFEGETHKYVAVAGETLKIRLPTRDADGDEVYYRARGLPTGAVWRAGDGFMQIEYNPPAELLEYPHTEVDLALEVSASDGPDVTKLLIDVQARACGVKQDACKDQSCAARHTMCPRCPISNVVRCSARAPILDPSTGHCHPAAHFAPHGNASAAAGPMQPAGYSFAVEQTTRLPLFDAQHQEVGSLLAWGGKSLHAAAGPQPHSGALACVEVATCPHAPAHAASASVMVQSSGAYGSSGLFLSLALTEGGHDGYGLCLGVWHKESMTWRCADEQLGVYGGSLGGRVHHDGCYAIMRDNCPDHVNPEQYDRDQDGEGDLCQGGATGCVDCHSYNALNLKYLRKHVPEHRELEHSECASYQCPTIITTEAGKSKYDARP